jgi:CheY-like chemotaxis protein
MNEETKNLKPCFHCYKAFDGGNLKWCECIRPLRTFVCRSCSRCFCTAPLPYKRDFWAAAPRRLREAPERFAHDGGAPSHHGSNAGAPVVLVVDDDEAIRSLIACRLAQLGYCVTTTGDPHHALMMARSREVAVVLTDVLMPRIDGRELCLRLKNTDEGSSKRVIVMTSLYKARRYADEAMLRYQADAFISKPIDFSHLSDLLEVFAPMHAEAAMAM